MSRRLKLVEDVFSPSDDNSNLTRSCAMATSYFRTSLMSHESLRAIDDEYSAYVANELPSKVMTSNARFGDCTNLINVADSLPGWEVELSFGYFRRGSFFVVESRPLTIPVGKNSPRRNRMLGNKTKAEIPRDEERYLDLVGLLFRGPHAKHHDELTSSVHVGIFQNRGGRVAGFAFYTRDSLIRDNHVANVPRGSTFYIELGGDSFGMHEAVPLYARLQMGDFELTPAMSLFVSRNLHRPLQHPRLEQKNEVINGDSPDLATLG